MVQEPNNQPNQPFTDSQLEQIRFLITSLEEGGFKPTVIYSAEEKPLETYHIVIEHDNDNGDRIQLGIINNGEKLLAYQL